MYTNCNYTCRGSSPWFWETTLKPGVCEMSVMSWRLSPGHRLNVVTIQCESLLRLLDRFKTPVADYSVAAATMRKCGLAIETLCLLRMMLFVLTYWKFLFLSFSPSRPCPFFLFPPCHSLGVQGYRHILQ